MAPTEKTTFGATVEPTSDNNPHTTPPFIEEKTYVTSIQPTTSLNSPSQQAANHFSSHTYAHPTLATDKDKPHIYVSQLDLESGSPSPYITTPNASHCSLAGDHSDMECAMWPTPQTLKEKARLQKRAQGCGPMRNLSRKQRLSVKLIVALVVVGLAVGLGVGISKAVGGGVWKGDDKPVAAIT